MQQQEHFENEQMEETRRRLEEEVKRREREAALEAHKEELNAFDQRIADLAAMIEKNAQLEDDEFNINAILIQFLEISLTLKKVMDMSIAINSVLSCVSDATNFIDSSMNFTDEIFKAMNTVKYGPFYRIRQKIVMRHTIKTQMDRMKAIVDRVNGTLTVGTMISTELSRMTSRLTQKKTKRGGGKVQSGGSYPLAAQYLAKRRGEESTGSTSAEAPTGSAPAPSAPSDGLSDIL